MAIKQIDNFAGFLQVFRLNADINGHRFAAHIAQVKIIAGGRIGDGLRQPGTEVGREGGEDGSKGFISRRDGTIDNLRSNRRHEFIVHERGEIGDGLAAKILGEVEDLLDRRYEYRCAFLHFVVFFFIQTVKTKAGE